MGPPACTNACTLGTHRCAGGGSETCVLGSNSCTEWSSATICAGVTACSAGSGLCACPTPPAGCTAAGKFCNGSGNLVTCSQDAQGCFSASAPAVCPTDTSCKGTLPNAACSCDNDTSCNGTNSFCLNPGVVATCGLDSNTPACNVVVSTATCHGSSSCINGACVCPAAGTTAGSGCTTLNAKTCSGTDILTCVTESSSGCSIWQASIHCATSGLTCGTKASAQPACQCPENAGTDVFVDPAAGSDVVGGVFPTGIQSPAACRYASLTNGLTKVGSPGRVIAISASLPAAFAGETIPLTIPDGVTVMTADAQFNAADYTIDVRSASTDAIVLGKGSALEGFTVDGTASANALIFCGTTGPALLDTVAVLGNGVATDGIDLLGGCAATLHNVTVDSVDAAGISVSVSTGITVTITDTTVENALQGGLLFKSGSVAADNLTTKGNTQYGIVLPSSSSGTPSLTLSNSFADGNGLAGNFPGIWIGKGTLAATNTEANNNGGAGIQLDSTSAQQLTTVTVKGNSAMGVGLTAGSLTASSLLADKNGEAGLDISGGTATITGSTLSHNTGGGLSLSGTGANVTVTGGALDNNGLGGILASKGTLTVGGNAEVASNPLGIQLTGATTSVAGANIHDNTGDGVVVNDSTSALVVLGSSSTTTTVGHNGGSGIVVDASPATSGGANSITIDTVAVTSNSGFGIHLEGDTGNVAATVKASTISGNHDVGLMVEQGSGKTTSEAIQNDDVSGNNTSGGGLVGGVLFNSSSTLTSFIGNKIHSNTGDELGFADVPNGGTQWVINPPSATCDATANSIYCYGGGNVGLHVLSSSASVNGQHVHWTNNPPTAGIDFSGAVTVTNPCTAIATCP
jgi:Right handed beta helix region